MKTNNVSVLVGAAILMATAVIGTTGCSNKASSVGSDGKLQHFAPRPNPANLTSIIQEDIKKNQSRITAMREEANAQHGGAATQAPAP